MRTRGLNCSSWGQSGVRRRTWPLSRPAAVGMRATSRGRAGSPTRCSRIVRVVLPGKETERMGSSAQDSRWPESITRPGKSGPGSPGDGARDRFLSAGGLVTSGSASSGSSTWPGSIDSSTWEMDGSGEDASGSRGGLVRRGGLGLPPAARPVFGSRTAPLMLLNEKERGLVGLGLSSMG